MRRYSLLIILVLLSLAKGLSQGIDPKAFKYQPDSLADYIHITNDSVGEWIMAAIEPVIQRYLDTNIELVQSSGGGIQISG